MLQAIPAVVSAESCPQVCTAGEGLPPVPVASFCFRTEHERNAMVPTVEAIAATYLEQADGDAGRALREVIADALADLEGSKNPPKGSSGGC